MDGGNGPLTVMVTSKRETQAWAATGEGREFEC